MFVCVASGVERESECVESVVARLCDAFNCVGMKLHVLHRNVWQVTTPSQKGQNLTLTPLCLPSSFDSGAGVAHTQFRKNYFAEM